MKKLIFASVCMAFIATTFTACEKKGSSIFGTISGTISGHNYVDLNLPSGTLWAMCNVGASKPQDYGDYFAWGETQPKSSYELSNYVYGYDSNFWDYKKYNDSDGNKILSSYDDVAYSNWGYSWRIPSAEQWQELIDECAWYWISYNGTKGYKVKSKISDNFIFLPAAGHRYSEGGLIKGMGYYWSHNRTENTSSAQILRFYDGLMEVDYLPRFNGLTVRPIVNR